MYPSGLRSRITRTYAAVIGFSGVEAGWTISEALLISWILGYSNIACSVYGSALASKSKFARAASVTGHFAQLCGLPSSSELSRRWECLVLRRIVLFRLRPAEHGRTECFLPQVPQSVFRCVHSNFPKFRPLCPGLRRWRVALPNRTQRSLSLRLRQEIQTVLRETRPVMIGEKKASSEKRSFCRTGCFQARPRWRVGEIEKPPACMQKPRSKNWPNGRCARGKPELARAMAPAIENRKAFRSELAARWILAAIDCEVCQAVRNYIRGRAS